MNSHLAHVEKYVDECLKSYDATMSSSFYVSYVRTRTRNYDILRSKIIKMFSYAQLSVCCPVSPQATNKGRQVRRLDLQNYTARLAGDH